MFECGIEEAEAEEEEIKIKKGKTVKICLHNISCIQSWYSGIMRSK